LGVCISLFTYKAFKNKENISKKKPRESNPCHTKIRFTPSQTKRLLMVSGLS